MTDLALLERTARARRDRPSLEAWGRELRLQGAGLVPWRVLCIEADERDLVDRPMLALAEHMRNAEAPEGPPDRGCGWSAGDQLEAVRFYLAESIAVVAESSDGGYEGSCVAVLDCRAIPGGGVALWRDSFGSCSGCDGLDGRDGYAYVKATLAEGNTRQFWSLEETEAYVRSTEDLNWDYVRGLAASAVAAAIRAQAPPP